MNKKNINSGEYSCFIKYSVCFDLFYSYMAIGMVTPSFIIIEEGKNLGWRISMKWAWWFHIRGPIEDGPNLCKVYYGRILH